MTDTDQQQPQAGEIDFENITRNLAGMRQWVALHGYRTESSEYDTEWLLAHVEILLATVARQAEQIERLKASESLDARTMEDAMEKIGEQAEQIERLQRHVGALQSILALNNPCFHVQAAEAVAAIERGEYLTLEQLKAHLAALEPGR